MTVGPPHLRSTIVMAPVQMGMVRRVHGRMQLLARVEDEVHVLREPSPKPKFNPQHQCNLKIRQLVLQSHNRNIKNCSPTQRLRTLLLRLRNSMATCR